MEARTSLEYGRNCAAFSAGNGTGDMVREDGKKEMSAGLDSAGP